MAVGILSEHTVYAKAAQIEIEVPNLVEKENFFQVKVVLNSDIELYSVDAYLSYDSEKLEWIPDQECVTGSGGILEIKEIFSKETTNAVYYLTFKAIDTGSVIIDLPETYIIDYADMDYIEVTTTKKELEIGINKKVERNSGLKELIVAPGELSHPFETEVEDYDLYVEETVDRIGVTAIPSDENSIVELDMPQHLQKGENLVLITVTAVSGENTIYTIHVYR